MKKSSYKKILLLCIIFFGSYSEALAQTGEYVTLVDSLPGIEGSTNINEYIPAAITLAITVAAVLAFAYITFGGIMYATTDAISNKSKGKEYITNAIYGLLLVIGAWAILNTLNPETVKINLSIPQPSISTNNTGVGTGPTGAVYCPPCSKVNGLYPGYVMTPLQKKSDLDNRAAVGGFVTVNANACETGLTRGCTNMNNLPASVIRGVRNLASSCEGGCTLAITGGTEGGHAEHAPDQPIVDIRAGDFDRILSNAKQKVPKDGGRYNIVINGARMNVKYEGTGEGRSTGDHWHVVFQ
ncbi:MAG: pilin [Minisyncoccia bacterium]